MKEIWVRICNHTEMIEAIKQNSLDKYRTMSEEQQLAIREENNYISDILGKNCMGKCDDGIWYMDALEDGRPFMEPIHDGTKEGESEFIFQLIDVGLNLEKDER